MSKATDQQPGTAPLDSWDYCIAFWAGALDDDEDQVVREIAGPRNVRTLDDVA